jgi:hypothetical protein
MHPAKDRIESPPALVALAVVFAVSGCGGSGSGASAANGQDASPVSGGDAASAGDGMAGGATADTMPAVDATSAAGDAGGSAEAGEAAAATDGSDSSSSHTQAVYMTFYGWPDNSPPGNAIAYPKNGGFPTVHNAAGGTGTYADPITFATDQAEFASGTILYASVIEKYLVMEDDCAECDTDWSTAKKWHIDVWMNSNASANSNAVLSCENQWTQMTTTVEVAPPPGRTITTPPLFDTTTNTCRTSP